MAGFSLDQNGPLHRGLHQLGASTNPNKCIAYPRKLIPRSILLLEPNYMYTWI